MKKQIQPYPRLNIFIHTNGATYNDSLYSINMWKPLLSTHLVQKSLNTKFLQQTLSLRDPVQNDVDTAVVSVSSELFLSSLDKFIDPKNSNCFFLKKKHKQKLESLQLKSNMNSDLLSEFKHVLNKRSHVNFLNDRVHDLNLLLNGNQKLPSSVSKQEDIQNNVGVLCLLHKIIACNKINLFNYLNLYSTNVTKIKALEMDTFSNPLWNVNKDNRFGTFEQASDNALSKFKKRYSV